MIFYGSVFYPSCIFVLSSIRRYENVFTDLPRLTAKINSVLLPSKYAYSGGVSFAIYETVMTHFTVK